MQKGCAFHFSSHASKQFRNSLNLPLDFEGPFFLDFYFKRDTPNHNKKHVERAV
jgi:hypothetical protein